MDDLVGEGEFSLETLSISDSHLVGIPDPHSLIATDLGRPVIPFSPWIERPGIKLYIIEVEKADKEMEMISPSEDGLISLVPNPKLDSRAYANSLSALIEKVKEVTQGGNAVTVQVANFNDFKRSEEGTTITLNSTPCDMVSARKLIIPILVALECTLSSAEGIDKTTIGASLHRLVNLWPDGNPPRAALKRVNELLMSGDRR